MSRTTGRPAALGAVDQVTRTALLSLKDSLSALDSRYVPVAGGVVLADAAQTIANVTGTDITWGTEVSDADGWHAAGVAAVVVPAGKGGRYLVTFSGQWSNPPTGSVFALVNGTLFQSGVTESIGNAHTLTFLTTLAAADSLTFRVYQASGGNLTVVSRLEICPV